MKSKIPLILVVLVISLCVYSFFYLFESYEETEDLGWDKKARRNPYLAAEQFLERAGLQVRSSNNFDPETHLPDGGMVFISNSSQTLTRKRVDTLIDWMEQGGHLVVAAPVDDDGRKDILLSRFNVENHPVERGDETDEEQPLSEQLEQLNENLEDQDPNAAQDSSEDPVPEDRITRLRFVDHEGALEAYFSVDSTLTHPAFYQDEDDPSPVSEPLYWTGSEFGTHFMQIEVGQGLLSILSDNSIWRSDRIDVLDHAYLLWLLSNKDAEVVLLYGASMPSIFHYLWKYAAEMFIALGLWLVGWLVYRSRRFGPIRGSGDSTHRSMIEHIHASGEYLWRDKRYTQLAEPLRNDIRTRMQRLYPDFAQLDAKARLKRIHHHSRIPLERIENAIDRPPSGDESEFTRIMYDLQKIRNTL